MSVYISWSGARSRAIASALYSWMQSYLPDAQPWMSDVAIAPGHHWSSEMARELAAADFGVVCLNPDNVNEPWLLFEAGAIAKRHGEAVLVPVLDGLKRPDLCGPLAAFQAIEFDKAGLRDLFEQINSKMDNRISRGCLAASLEAGWPALAQAVAGHSAPSQSASPYRLHRAATTLGIR